MVYRCAAHTHIVALACACALTCAASTRADLVVESVDIGVGGIVRGGGWTRFAVTLATDTEGFEGTAYVSLGAEENGIELALVRNGRTRWETVARTPDLPTDGTVRWVDTAQAESSYSFPIPAPLAPNDLGVLAVTSTAGTLAYVGGEIRLDGADPDSPQRVRVKPSETGSLSSLPSDWLAWSGVDVVVWRGLHPNSSAWAPAQQTALLRWIRRGGTFVWLEDAGTPTLDGTPLAPLMALAPANWVDMSLPRGDSLRVPVSIRTGTLAPGARSVLTVEGNPLIAARDIGMGRALYVGVPLAACTPTMEAALWRDVFGAVRRQPLAPWERLDPAQRQRLVDRLNALPESAPAR
ncbi:hypothetical protein FJZ36_06940, partial [Candidatus Poribacteria bacterium]|nr:hypothetical protein [Candidatus Poribacteria bacterium]